MLGCEQYKYYIMLKIFLNRSFQGEQSVEGCLGRGSRGRYAAQKEAHEPVIGWVVSLQLLRYVQEMQRFLGPQHLFGH